MRTTSRLSAIPGAALVASRRRCGPEGLRAAVRACATAAPAAPAYHTIVKAEIPVHLPRQDLLKQLFRWAVQDAEAAVTTYGVPMTVEVIDITEFLSIGFTIFVHEYAANGSLNPRVALEILMDDEEVDGFDSVGSNEAGFPVLQTNDGEKKVVKGRCLIVRRDAAKPVPADLVPPVKSLLSNLTSALNKYYAFGSCFSEEF